MDKIQLNQEESLELKCLMEMVMSYMYIKEFLDSNNKMVEDDIKLEEEKLEFLKKRLSIIQDNNNSLQEEIEKQKAKIQVAVYNVFSRLDDKTLNPGDYEINIENSLVTLTKETR